MFITSWGRKTSPSKCLDLPPHLVEIKPFEMTLIECQHHRGSLFLNNLCEIGQGLLIQDCEVEEA